ncbi:MAG: hypothetical protein IPL84_13060 [Chitinophagaceae bacterium]|nr:hypothetical protein [Chitinophagaceae bacterium]
MKKLLIPLISVILLASCSNYYKAITATEPTKAASFNDFQDSSKYYILRNGNEAFVMKNISMSSDRKNVQCTLEDLPVEHKLYVTEGTAGNMKYKAKDYANEDETGVLNEVHIYTIPGNKIETGAYTLAFENIQKAEIIEKDKIKTKRSHVTGTIIGWTVAGVGIIGIIIGILAIIVSSTGFL